MSFCKSPISTKNEWKALITTPFMWEEHEIPYDFARYTTPALLFFISKKMV
jgi:hypothetical protein